MTTGQGELTSQRTVIVAGAQGVSGRVVLERYAALPFGFCKIPQFRRHYGAYRTQGLRVR
jgi:hypothetical protein